MSFTITSRVARKPIVIPTGVNINLNNANLEIKGSKGSIVLPIHPDLKITINDGILNVGTSDEDDQSTTTGTSGKQKRYSRSGTGSKLLRSIPGTTRAKIQNAVNGVSKGFERKLQLVGVGYKAAVKGKNLELALGFSHPVIFEPEEGITFETPSVTEIIVKGIRRDLVGYVAAKIRAIRSPEPYKGKGVRYSDEVVIRKETKKK
ncbi:MAG: 50S ribosomal protein L6 [Gammaproteobacteria bacterium]|nr:50S ribosomal protein L6 [Gammaproteobacteria bacterium]